MLVNRVSYVLALRTLLLLYLVTSSKPSRLLVSGVYYQEQIQKIVVGGRGQFCIELNVS